MSEVLRKEIKDVRKLIQRTPDQHLKNIAFGSLQIYFSNIGNNKKTVLIVAHAIGILLSIALSLCCFRKRVCFPQQRQWIRDRQCRVKIFLFGPDARRPDPIPPPQRYRSRNLAIQHLRTELTDDLINEID